MKKLKLMLNEIMKSGEISLFHESDPITYCIVTSATFKELNEINEKCPIDSFEPFNDKVIIYFEKVGK